MNLTVTLRLFFDDAACHAGLAALADFAERRPELVDGFLSLVDRGDAFEMDQSSAGGAGDLRLRLQPTETLLRFCRAGGAGDDELSILQRAFDHDVHSGDGDRE